MEQGGARIPAIDTNNTGYSAMAPALIAAAFQLMGIAPGILRRLFGISSRPKNGLA
jgi:hypothetical protein